MIGSPPRVWVVPNFTFFKTSSLRITPTCVGSTLELRHLWIVAEDHPHVCG